jgi:hypothetical protein
MERASGIMNEDRERSELEAVLASTLFMRAPDLSKILKYVCEKRFTNQTDAIKEYNIALKALGRGPDFRPEEDSIVRVQAARLRKQLKKYYETDGARHSVQIRIPATGYKPEFVYVQREQSGAVSASPDAERDGGTATRADVAINGPEEAAPTPEKRHAPQRKRNWMPTKGILLVAFVGAAVLIVATILHLGRRSAGPVARQEPSLVPPAASPSGVNIRAGLSDPTYLDAAGSMWLGDRYFTGGQTFTRTDTQVLRTLDQSLYRTGRMGTFSYAIPLAQGDYEVHLHFAEIFFPVTAGADTQRTFDISINGAIANDRFDIAKDAGGVYIADEKIFKDISPGKDGFLRVAFMPVRNQALLNGIEVLPGGPGKMLPVRILCSNHSSVDKNGLLWKADQYFSGGRIAERPDLIQDPGLGSFSSYRTGNFDYAIPVADSEYRVRLFFAEPVFGRDTPAADAPGRRVFDIYCNGKVLVSGLDIFKDAGGAYRVIEKTLRRVKPDAQGKIRLSFVPVQSYAVLLSIEVADEGE